MPKPLTRNELLDYIAKVEATETVHELAGDEFTMGDLLARGMTEHPAVRLVKKLEKDGKVTKRMARFRGRMAAIYKWVGKVPKT
jgi:hypothetical protein